MKIKKLDYLIELIYDKAYKGYVAEVVNLYGCMSQGKTKEEALTNIDKAIKAFIKFGYLHVHTSGDHAILQNPGLPAYPYLYTEK